MIEMNDQVIEMNEVCTDGLYFLSVCGLAWKFFEVNWTDIGLDALL